MEIKLALSILKLKGYLSYEYNSFHNYRTSVDLYIVNNTYIVPSGMAVNIKNGRLLTKQKSLTSDSTTEIWEDEFGLQYLNTDSNIVIPNSNNQNNNIDVKKYADAGSLIDLDTDKLQFDLNHPVDITVLPSYDGSVNLILNDGKNIPRLINSRFSVREKNTYEIVDRIGENDTNIYKDISFDKDTSLYFQCGDNPTVKFSSYIKGDLPVGLYCFYFTYSDSDDNESDYIAESGLVPLFIGNVGEASSMDGGIKNQNSNKGISLLLENLDKSYNYIKVYYVRYFADYGQNRVYEGKKLTNRFAINSNILSVQITGNEELEDFDPNYLNISKFNPQSVLTQAQCKNMLFFGNIVKNTDDYRELQDCALRITPRIFKSTIDLINDDYSNKGGYYSAFNMYNKVGYMNQEYYRFGVVFIYNNGTLSNVYNTLGGIIDDNVIEGVNIYKNTTVDSNILLRNYIKIDNDGWIIDDYSKVPYANAKGTCKINYNGTDNLENIYGILFYIPDEVVEYLNTKLNIRGLFFVRQKRIPNILCLCMILPMDNVLLAPTLYYNNQCVLERFINDGRILTNDYNSRLYRYNLNSEGSKNYAAICPDFLLNLAYYNLIFNSSEFYFLKISTEDSISNLGRFYISLNKNFTSSNPLIKATLCTVTENVPTVAIKDSIFRLNIGEATQAYRFRSLGIDLTSYNLGGGDESNVYNINNIFRGIFSPYVAVKSDSVLDLNAVYNIYKSNKNNDSSNFKERMNYKDGFYAISDRLNFNKLAKITDNRIITCYRGDCYINQFTYRLNRNFNDSSLPNNDVIIDSNTWMNNYQPEHINDIILSDVNAVLLGLWITFKLRSSMNYALRSLDLSYVSETSLMGSPRTFYPKSKAMWYGDYKMPDSYLYNDAYRSSLGFKCYYNLLDVNYLKNNFSNRIQYSSIAILDSFKNNYRESLSTYFRDYSIEYGGITKLVEYGGNLLVIFEHAIGLAVINERILAGQSEGNPVFINTQNVLPEELTIITDTYGSLWTESIIKSEAGYVYGVDTIAKKIWRVKGLNVEILSDFKVNKFLVENISLGERETSPTVGLRNVKTHYNNNKKDIMFTFYDDYYEDEEKVWNLCYNELLGLFITFYSWVPSYSENIDTQFFTFNRESSKILSLLESCNYNIPSNTGILLDTPILVESNNKYCSTLHYRDLDSKALRVKIKNSDGTYSDSVQKITENLSVIFKLEKDHWRNNENFNIVNKNKLISKDRQFFNNKKHIILNVSAYLGTNKLKTQTIAVTIPEIIKRNDATGITTDFYLHGRAGIFNVAENLYPTYWYGEYHPFEFEFVVNDKVAQLKIFNNLIIISNKAEPESFHFEIEGDNYEFSSDKRAMYVRQEATKELYLNLGSDILFNRKYYDVVSNKYTLEQSYRAKIDKYMDQYSKMDRVYPVYQEGLIQLVKSTIFPLYYEKIDTYNDIYHKYHMMHDNDGIYDFQNLSGSEIAWDRDLNQFNIVTHIKNCPIDLVGRLRGNSFYKEGSWNVQIPSITFMLKNEIDWPLASSYKENGKSLLETTSEKIPPVVINSQYVPKDLAKTTLGIEDLPNIYTGRLNNIDKDDTTKVDYSIDPAKYIDTSSWTARKETKIRDKWIKIRIRYSGKNLAVIHSLITLYNISYS